MIPARTHSRLKWKKPTPLRDFGPGGQHRHDTQEECQQYEQKAEAVHREMKVNAKLGNPAPVHLLEPVVRAVTLTLKLRAQKHQPRTKSRQTAASEIQRQSSGSSVPPATQEARRRENDDQPEQNHKNNTTAMKTTDPAAMPAAYQRRRPVSVRLRTRQASSLSRPHRCRSHQ